MDKIFRFDPLSCKSGVAGKFLTRFRLGTGQKDNENDNF
jgi:hypothetical protein